MKASYKRSKTNSRRQRTRKTTGGGFWSDLFSTKTPEQKDIETQQKMTEAKKIRDDKCNAANKEYNDKITKIDPTSGQSGQSGQPVQKMEGGKRRRKSKKAQ